jgi:uncharacterized membrane protein
MLLLLVLVPWSVWIGVRIRSLSRGRKWTAVGLRSLILICLIGALAGAEWIRINDRLAVFFVLDHSNSISAELRRGVVQRVRNLCDEFMIGDKDQAGVIVFGEDASIERAVKAKLELDDIQSFVSGEETNLAGAIRLAVAAFPQGFMRRMVIFSDGNETQGDALEEVKIARASGAEVNVIPLLIGGSEEVLVREVSVPSRVDAGEPFQVRVVVHSEQDCDATVSLFQRLREGKQLLRTQPVTLQKGDNTFLLTQDLENPGFYEYEAVIESNSDTIQANNEGSAFTVIQGEPTVLYVEGDPEHSMYLAPALESEGIRIVQAGSGDVPTSLAQFQNYDAIVLSNVSATDLSSQQMRSIEAAVRDLGVGLVMIGGENSFGSGGYLDTPVEKALPVTMDLKQRKILPRGALVLVMHTCEIPNGNAWAREIGLASLNVLSSQDLMGALGYMHQTGDSWIYKLQPVGDKGMMRSRLTSASSAIGDMPSVAPTLQMAYDALAGADAAVKRVVMISDGDPQPPSAGLLKRFAESKISVSTVCTAPHSNNDQDMLKWVANTTGGQYYFVQSPNNLPQIFTKEAAQVKRGILIEKPFMPKPFHGSEVLSGFPAGAFPVLRGYVATSPKESATLPLLSEEDDPVLAHWRYGLGKSVAFTSDVTNRWAADWLGWEGFNRFWAQTVRWVVREVSRSSFLVQSSIREGKGYVRIDAVDEDGKFVNFLRPKGTSTGPGPEFARSDIDLVQTGPGIYEGSFPLGDRGIYMVNLMYAREDGSEGVIPTGLSLDYSREYEYNTTNLPLLEQSAADGGGKVLAGSENPFIHNLKASPMVTPVWHYLAIVAVCLFPIEIFVRRVVVNFGGVYAWFAAGMRKVPALGKYIPVPDYKPAPVTGRYGAAAYRDFAGGAPSRELTGSFGIVAEPEPIAAAGARPAGEEFPATEAETGDGGHSEYTRKLFEAKKRAQEKTERRAGKDDS